MCGVVGISTRDEKFIDTALKQLRHRGPDGAGKYIDASISLGHTLLAITSDPKLGQQPYKTARGNILVYNGEIFNYDDLLAKYTQFKPRTTCDTELLAWGLDHYGMCFVEQIDSQHAFVYYDTQKQKLYLSRDHVGIKPLYYAEIKEGIVFASEIEPLRSKVAHSNQIDPVAHSSWSLLGVNFTRNTFYTGIKKIMPGECMVYDIPTKRLSQVSRYFATTNTRRQFDAEEFRSQVRDVCRKTIRGLRKTAIFLSGGLDSSMITHEIAHMMPNVTAYTNRIDPCPQDKEDFNSDWRCAVELAKKLNIEHHTITCTPETWRDYLYLSVQSLEEPCYNSSLPMYYQTNRYMALDGVVVTIAGDMGDETLAGYKKYSQMPPTGTYRELVAHWMKRLSQPPKVPCALTSDQLLKVLMTDVFTDAQFNPIDPVNSFMLLDITANCAADFFQRNDRFGMTHSMEGRFPLATKQWIEYTMSIASAEKYNGGMKLMSKRAYHDRLPHSIIHKPKTGWTAPHQQWCRQSPQSADVLRRHQPPEVRKYWNTKRESVMHQYYTWRQLQGMTDAPI